MTLSDSLLHRVNLVAFRVCVVSTNLLLALLVINNLLEMMARTLFGTSIGWVFEIDLLLAIWLYFLGIFQVYFRRGDISVDVVMRKLPLHVQRWVAILIDVVIVGTLLMISWHAVQLIMVQWPFKSPGLRLPNPLFTAPVLIGSVMMSLTMFERLLQRLTSPEHLPSGVAGMDI